MTVDITEWGAGGNAGVNDGVHTLTVNQGEFIFSNQSRTTGSTDNILTIKTTPLLNWTAQLSSSLSSIVAVPNDVVTESPWLSLSPSSSGNGNNNSVSLVIPSNPNTTERIAYVHITAGSLTYKVKVTQEGKNGVMYVGMFAGTLANQGGGVWSYSEPMYVQTSNETSGIQWQQNLVVMGGTVVWSNAGRQNTYNLYFASATTHPAANACFQKNNNYSSISSMNHSNYIWYLPSQIQLMACWVSSNSFAAEDKFNINANSFYWSSTEFGTIHGWSVGFTTGDVAAATVKTELRRVRCVREIP